MVQHLQETDIDGGAGDIKDSASTNNGTTSGMDAAAQVPGKINGGFDFDGTDDVVTTGNVIGSANAVTVSAWVNHDNLTTAVERYISLSDNVVIRHNGAGSVGQLHFYISTGGTLKHLNVDGALTNDTWYHVVGTWDGTTQRVYLNGLERDSQDPGGTLDTPANCSISSGGATMDGTIDEVRVSTVARSPAWIQAEVCTAGGVVGGTGPPQGLAVTSAVAEIAPNAVSVSSTGNAFTYDILPTIGGSNTGVNQVVITAPAGYSSFSVTAVSVGGAGQGPLNCPTPTPATTEYCASVAGQDITVTLGTKVTVDATNIQIQFTADAPGSAGSADFTATVEDTGTVEPAQATVAGDADGDAGDDNSRTVTAGYTISGAVSEDVNGDADLGDAVGYAGATVHLYRDSGNAVIDGGETLIDTTTTDGSGNYSFTGLSDGTHYVVVDSKTLAAAGYNGSFTIDDIWASQTYAVSGAATGAAFTATSGAFYGGRNIGTSDDASDLATAEHVIRRTISGADRTGVNFGFSFNVVTNMRGGDATDDDGGGTPRTIQGSLRQFIQNANAITGANAMRFVPAVATNQTGGGGDWWELAVTTALPDLTDAGTTIDGTAYSSADGVTVNDVNPGQVGTGGTVGVDGLTLDLIDRPELELNGGNAFTAPGLVVDAGTITISNLAMNGFGTNPLDAHVLINATVTAAAGEAVITGNLIGTNADGSDAGWTERLGIYTNGATTITNNYIVYIEGNGVMTSAAWSGSPNAEQVNFINNEVAFIQYAAGLFGDAVSDIADGAVIRGNYIHDYVGSPTAEPNLGKGIEFWYETQNALIENNTIENMYTAGIGINDGADNNTIRRNIITGTTGDGANGGAGILITGFNDTAAAPATANTITENHISGNAGLGIDLDVRVVVAGSVGDGVTANDGGDGDTGPNDLLNYPVTTTATETAGTITVDFDLDTNTASYYRVEFFKNPSGADGSGNGEGESYADAIVIDHTGSGVESFSHSFAGSAGDIITVTTTVCTDGATCAVFGSTSEFSAAITVSAMAVTSAVAEIAPNTVGVSSTGNAFTYDILPTIGGSNTGVDQVVITAPAGYASLTVIDISVGGAGQGPLNCPTPTPATTEYCASVAGQDITVTLGTKVTVDATNIQVQFTADAPGSIGSADFTATVDDTGSAVLAQATVAGNADGDGADADSQTVTVENNAVTSAVAEITPNAVGVSSTGNAFTYDILPTIGGSDTGVDQVVITAPAGFGSFSVTAVSVGGAGQGPLNCPTPTPATTEYCASIAVQDITVTLGTKVTVSGTNIKVSFDADAPGSAGSGDFTATVDDSATTLAAQAAAEGNADGDGGDGNNWTVVTLGAASIYYVRTDGNDGNAGTTNTPGGAWQTIQHAAATMTAGDIVYVQPGTYYGESVVANSGSAGNPITFIADGAVTIDGQNVACATASAAFTVDGKDYVIIDGFEMTNFRDCGGFSATVYINNSSYGEVKNCVIRDTGRDGIGLDGNSSNFVVDNNLIYNTDDDCISPRGNGSHTFTNNTIYNCGQWALEGAGTTGNIYRYNIFWDSIDVTGGVTWEYNDYINAVLPGTGNIQIDPQFVNAAGGDFHLKHALLGQTPQSSCIDAGGVTAASRNLDTRTTRTDGVVDTGNVDLGYHYPNGSPAVSISGTVFEDVNYGGGTGRNYATADTSAVNSGWVAGDIAVDNVTVELYDNAGNFVTSATTAVDGTYSFANLLQAIYTVRVVNSTVKSNRTSTDNSEVAVQVYRADGDGEGAGTGATKVGGERPIDVDAPANGGSDTLAVLQGVAGQYTQSIVTVNASGGNVTGVDFGFNFDTIVNTNDDSQGSLRQFMLNANVLSDEALMDQVGLTTDVETSIFMIPSATDPLSRPADPNPNGSGNGEFAIQPGSVLPTISTTFVLDATTQTTLIGNTNAGGPEIALDGSGLGPAINGLNITADNSTVRGVVINQFQGHGIDISGGASGNVVAGNYIGTNVLGSAALANSWVGVNLNGAGPNNRIGGTAVADRNVISGNGQNGVALTGGSNTNLVQGNYIGLNPAGTGPVANTFSGIAIDSSAGNTIGGTAAGAGNVISGNTQQGMWINNSDGTLIQGNIIGLNEAGDGPVANGNIGIVIEGASTNTVVGGTTANHRNIISANTSYGVYINGAGTTGNRVEGNYIGLDQAGTGDQGNGGDGVRIAGGAAGNFIGGTASGAGNVISGNADEGIDLTDAGTSNNRVEGNYIGTNAAGTSDIPNDQEGVSLQNGASDNIIGGASTDARNVISGNTRYGIYIIDAGTDRNIIQGNYIGTQVDGTSPLANVLSGIIIQSGAQDNVIGGTGADEGNVIAFNGRDGVSIGSGSTTGNTVRGNRIHSNTDLGIDLSGGTENGFGVTSNDGGDGDTGPNNLQNYPVLTSAGAGGGTVYIAGTLNSNITRDFNIDFFLSSAADGSGFGEGAIYLGSTTVTTDGGGDASFNVNFAAAVSSGDVITATATDTTTDDTSEFSNAETVLFMAATSALAQITPNIAGAGIPATAFTYDILPTIGGNDTGINRVVITTPAGYGSLNVNAVSVGGAGQGPLNCPTPTPATTEYCASVAGQDITVTLGTKVILDATNIQVQFTADTPGSTGSADFTATVEDTGSAAPVMAATQGDGNNDGGIDGDSWTVTLNATAALTGTVTDDSETDIRTGGSTLILTLTGDTWVAAGGTFDAQRQNIINGLDSAGAEASGWNAIVKAGIPVANVVRTSATVVTITLPAFGGYDITATETITATVPNTALVGSGVDITAAPTFDVTVSAGTVALTGTVTDDSETEIRTGGSTIILTLTDDTWDATVGANNAITTALIDGIDSAQAEAAGWDAVAKAGLTDANVVRTSNTVVTITLPAFGGYDITATETITATVPATALVQSGADIAAAPTFDVTVSAGTVALTGTVTDDSELDIRAGGSTIILTLTDDTWDATVGANNAITTALINGIDSAQAEGSGWDAVVKAGLTDANVVRTSDTVVTITLPAFGGYDITAAETITATVPASALVQSGVDIVAAPTFNVAAADTDLVIAKTVDDTGPDEGQTITYTITLTNNGPLQATNIVVTDVVPSGITYVAASITGGDSRNEADPAGAGLSWTVNSLNNGGASTSLTFEATVDAGEGGNTIANTATKIQDQDDNNATVDDPGEDITVVYPNITLSKAADKANARPDETVTYTLTYGNTGTGDATNLVITDTIPANTTLVNGSITGGGTESGGVITWNLGALAAGVINVTVQFDVTVDTGTAAGTLIDNEATANYDDALGAGQTPVTSNTATVTVDQVGGVLVAPDQSGSVSSATGSTIDYGFIVTNTGNGNDWFDFSLVKTGPQFWPAELLDATGTILIAQDSDADGLWDYVNPAYDFDTDGRPDTGTLAASATMNVVLRLTVPAGTTPGDQEITSLVGTSNYGPVSDRATATSTAVTGVDTSVIAFGKSDSPDPALAGSSITYTLTYRNSGTRNANSVVIFDSIPANTTYIAGSAWGEAGVTVEFSTNNRGSWGAEPADPATVTDIRWSVGTLARNSGDRTAGFQVQPSITLPDGSIIDNAATLQGNRISDINASAATTIRSAVAFTNSTKTVAPALTVPGATLTYTINVTNSGAADGNNVVVTDLIPAQTTYVASSITGPGADDSGAPTLVWNLGTVASGASVGPLTFQVTVDNPVAANTFFIDNQATIDSDQTNPANTTTASTSLVASPFFVGSTKTAADLNGGILQPTDTIEYRIEVINSGNMEATGVVVTDTVPADTTYELGSIFGTGANETLAPDLSWNVGTLAAGASTTLTFRTTVNGGTANGTLITNLADIVSDQTAAISTAPVVLTVGGGTTGTIDSSGSTPRRAWTRACSPRPWPRSSASWPEPTMTAPSTCRPATR
jgi:uncharacterized repeat protein (TIGR01451 family)